MSISTTEVEYQKGSSFSAIKLKENDPGRTITTSSIAENGYI